MLHALLTHKNRRIPTKKENWRVDLFGFKVLNIIRRSVRVLKIHRGFVLTIPPPQK
jgi:hypothetical protein